MGMADQIIVHGATKGFLVNPENYKICLIGAALLDAGVEVEEILTETKLEKESRYYAMFDSNEKLASHRNALMEVLPNEERFAPSTVVLSFNDKSTTSEDDILRTAKQADEVMNR